MAVDFDKIKKLKRAAKQRNAQKYKDTYKDIAGKGTIVTQDDNNKALYAGELDEVTVRPSNYDKGERFGKEVINSTNETGKQMAPILGGMMIAPFAIGAAAASTPAIGSYLSNPVITNSLNASKNFGRIVNGIAGSNGMSQTLGEISRAALGGMAIDTGYELATGKPAQLGEALDVKNPVLRFGANMVSPGMFAGMGVAGGKSLSKPKNTTNNIKEVFNFRSYSDSAKKFVIEDAKDFKEVYNYLSDPRIQQRLQNIDKELGTNYERVVKEYLNAADKHPNKEVFINNADQSIKQRFASTKNEGSSWVIDNSYLFDPLNPSNYWMLVRSNRSPGTVGHEVKHLLEMMETASRLTKEDKLKILSGKAEIADYINNSPRLKKLIENNTIDFDTWRNTIINNGGDDVTLDDYNYFKKGTEFNSQLHPIVLERTRQGKSGLFNYNNTKELFEDIDNAVKRENDHSLYYLESLVKDKRKLIEVLNKYGFASIPAAIGVNSIKDLNDGKR